MTINVVILFIIPTFYSFVNHCVHSNELTSVIQTDKGLVQGEFRRTIRRSIVFSSFRGIRYGKSPTGYARFKPPEEAEPWSEIFDATAEGTPCPQIDFRQGRLFVDEDCLNLNVYSPRINFDNTNRNLLPVMVWIYGGSFVSGNTNMRFYGPDFLIENGVVVVAMNYRLGILGFLSLNLPNATGNAGLKDQQLALKWVQRNIKNFGGDPSSVTIFGVSAGAASVDYHALSDGSQGLFHRSISMSGSSLCTWAFSLASQATERAFQLGSLLGINTTDKNKLLAELYTQSAHDLVMAADNMNLADPLFKPTLEDTKISEYTTVVGIIGAPINQVSKLSETEAYDIILHSHNVNLDISVALSILNNDTYRDIVTILTDVLIVSGTDIKQRYLTRYGSAPVFYYRNSFAPYISSHRFLDGVNVNGAAHGDDLAYCWYISIANFSTNPDDPFVVMQDRITRMWTNFAKYSNPTPFGKNDSLLNISWPVSGLDGVHLEINEKFSVGGRPIDHITELHEVISKSSLDMMNGC